MKHLYLIAKHNTLEDFLKIVDDEISKPTRKRIEKILTIAKARREVQAVAPKYVTKVAHHFGVKRSDIVGKCRDRDVSYIRGCIVLALERQFPKANCADITKHVSQPHYFLAHSRNVFEKNNRYDDYMRYYNECNELLTE
ncbi:MAG: hypothetical protein OEY89_01360 [Gammaproteobacteria bacterium]|nr:hypothetical protein [Gammaproteobacteria bacterium]